MDFDQDQESSQPELGIEPKLRSDFIRGKAP